MDKNLEELQSNIADLLNDESFPTVANADVLAEKVMKLVRPAVEKEAGHAYNIGYKEGRLTAFMY